MTEDLPRNSRLHEATSELQIMIADTTGKLPKSGTVSVGSCIGKRGLQAIGSGCKVPGSDFDIWGLSRQTADAMGLL